MLTHDTSTYSVHVLGSRYHSPGESRRSRDEETKYLLFSSSRSMSNHGRARIIVKNDRGKGKIVEDVGVSECTRHGTREWRGRAL